MVEDNRDAVARRREEARRRVAILRRYTAIEHPSAADDERYAKELGQSVARLRQLVRAWKLHGDRALTPIEAKADPDSVRRAISVAEGPLDLHGVFPERRDEIERRIRLVGRYLAAGERNLDMTNDFAKEYGAHPTMFRKAVTAWVLTPDPKTFPGARIVRIKKDRRRFNVDDAVAGIVAEAIRELGTEMGGTALHRLVAERCHAAGQDAATPSYVYARMMEARTAPPLTAGPDRSLCLERVALRPNRHGGPVLLEFLFGSPSGRIHGHSLHACPPAPRFDARLLSNYLRTPPQAGPTVLLEYGLPDGASWSSLDEALRAGGVSVWLAHQRRLNSGRLAFATFGDRIGPMAIKRINPRIMGLLRDCTEAAGPHEEAVAEAVATHNRNRQVGRPPLVAEGLAGDLADLLASNFG